MAQHAAKYTDPSQAPSMRHVSRGDPSLDVVDINPKDQQVLLDAIAVDADVLVTDNLGDFPIEVMTRYKPVALSAEQTLLRICKADASKFVDAIDRQIAGYKQFPRNRVEYADLLRQRGYTRLLSLVEMHWRQA